MMNETEKIMNDSLKFHLIFIRVYGSNFQAKSTLIRITLDHWYKNKRQN